MSDSLDEIERAFRCYAHETQCMRSAYSCSECGNAPRREDVARIVAGLVGRVRELARDYAEAHVDGVNALARVDELEDALREIAALPRIMGKEHAIDIARAALSGTDGGDDLLAALTEGKS